MDPNAAYVSGPLGEKRGGRGTKKGGFLAVQKINKASKNFVAPSLRPVGMKKTD